MKPDDDKPIVENPSPALNDKPKKKRAPKPDAA
jgi:hypothetical protein